MTVAHRADKFGDVLRRLRIGAGLTQSELAERAGLSARGVQDLERGIRRTPHPETVRRLATALGLGEAERIALLSGVQPASGAPLPLSPTPLIGREAELLAARAHLLDPHVRMLTLTGIGGTGKTRLALEVAEQMRDDFGQQVHFVDLAPLYDPAAVLPAIAHALGAMEASGRSPTTAICDLLNDRRVLVLLDNVEHLLPGVAAPVADLLAHCRGLHVLATSREPLHISWEHELPVPPLALPDARVLPPVEELAAVASVALFLFRARRVDPTFVLSVSNARAVADICARLDGLPLALELAAAHLKHFTPTELAAGLQQRLVLLVDGPRDAPRRQRTLRDALTWSYDLLTADEQRLFRAMSICQGGADPATIANLWTAAGGVGDPLALARSLLDKSLLTRAFVQPEGLRVTMLETVHEFALHELVAHGEDTHVSGAHATYFLALAEDARARWETPEAPVWLDRVEREHANLRAAFTWFVDHHQADAAMRLAASLAWFWRTRGYANEGRAHLETALALDPHAATTGVRADALHQSGELARILALYDVAEERLTQALAAFRALGNRRGVALTLDLLSATARFQGHYATARGFLQEALPIARELGDPALLRKCLVSLGALATNQGDLNAAPPWLEEALTVARHEGDLVGQVQALCYLGIVATQLGDFVGAEQRLRLAVDANQRLGDLDYWATLFDALAGLAGARGHFRRALRLMGAADRVLHDVGTRSLPPVRQARRDAWLKAAHASLALQAVDAAQREGESLDLDEAVVLALSEDNPS